MNSIWASVRGCPGPQCHLAAGPAQPQLPSTPSGAYLFPPMCTWHPSFPRQGGDQGKLSYRECILSPERGNWAAGLPRIWPPAAEHGPLQGKLRQGWSHSLSLRGGISHNPSWEGETWACKAKFLLSPNAPSAVGKEQFATPLQMGKLRPRE